MPASLDHLAIAASDLARSVGFYDAALGALGLVRTAELSDEEEDDVVPEAVGWGAPDGRVLVWVIPGAIETRTATRNAFLQLRADSRADVEAFHAAAMAAGGTEHSAPRRWPLYRRGEFNAIVADPDGNLVEAVAPE